MTNAILVLREKVTLMLIVAMLTISPSNQQQCLKPSANVQNWQKSENVKETEKKLESSAVKISLSKKVKYKLNGTTVRTKEVLGFVKNKDFRKWWNQNIGGDEKTATKVENADDLAKATQNENEKLSIYDSKDSKVSTIYFSDLKELELYNNGKRCGTIEVSDSKCNYSYLEYEFDDEGRIIQETMWCGGFWIYHPHVCPVPLK